MGDGEPRVRREARRPWAVISNAFSVKGKATAADNSSPRLASLRFGLLFFQARIPKVVFTFPFSKILLYSGVNARGGFGHVRGTEWGAVGHQQKMFPAARIFWHGSSLPHRSICGSVACRRSCAQQESTFFNKKQRKFWLAKPRSESLSPNIPECRSSKKIVLDGWV